MTKTIRQGDIAFCKIEELPKDLEPSKENILMANGSGGHPHSFSSGEFYPKIEGDFVIGYLVAKGTTIHHPEHNPKGDKIPDGVYEIRKQCEFVDQQMKPVID